MCGCTSGSNGLVNSSGCSGRVSDLHKVRNTLITLETLAETPDKKEEYKGVRTDVEQLLKETVEAYPDLQTVVTLKE